MTPIEKLSIVKNDLNIKYVKLVSDVEKLTNDSALTYESFVKKMKKKLNKMARIKLQFELLDELFEIKKDDNN